jgi:hypothetical protein
MLLNLLLGFKYFKKMIKLYSNYSKTGESLANWNICDREIIAYCNYQISNRFQSGEKIECEEGK